MSMRLAEGQHDFCFLFPESAKAVLQIVQLIIIKGFMPHSGASRFDKLSPVSIFSPGNLSTFESHASTGSQRGEHYENS